MKRKYLILVTIIVLQSCAFKSENDPSVSENIILNNQSMQSLSLRNIPTISFVDSRTTIKNYTQKKTYVEVSGVNDLKKVEKSIAAKVLEDKFSLSKDINTDLDFVEKNKFSLVSLNRIERLKTGSEIKKSDVNDFYIDTTFNIEISMPRRIESIKNIIIELVIFDKEKNRDREVIFSRALMKNPDEILEIFVPNETSFRTKSGIKISNVRISDNELSQLIVDGDLVIRISDFDYIQDGYLKNYTKEKTKEKSEVSKIGILIDGNLKRYITQEKTLDQFLIKNGFDVGVYSDGTIRAINSRSTTNVADLNPLMITNDNKDKSNWYFLNIENNYYSKLFVGEEYLIAHMGNLEIGKNANEIEHNKINNLFNFNPTKKFLNDEILLQISFDENRVPIIAKQRRKHEALEIIGIGRGACLEYSTGQEAKPPSDMCPQPKYRPYTCNVSETVLNAFSIKNPLTELKINLANIDDFDRHVWNDLEKGVLYLDQVALASIEVKEFDEEKFYIGYVSDDCDKKVCDSVGCITNGVNKNRVLLSSYITKSFNVQILREGARGN